MDATEVRWHCDETEAPFKVHEKIALMRHLLGPGAIVSVDYSLNSNTYAVGAVLEEGGSALVFVPHVPTSRASLDRSPGEKARLIAKELVDTLMTKKKEEGDHLDLDGRPRRTYGYDCGWKP